MSPSPAPSEPLRIRRHQPTRLEGFVDASFAFAVTILVISVGHVPTSVPEMLHALRGLPAFALSFLMIARFWKAHRDWSRCYDIEDGSAVTLSLLLVFLVLVFVYPLRFIFALLFLWLSGGFLIDQPLQPLTIDQYRVAFEVFGIGFASVAGIFALLYRHALRARESVGLTTSEIIVTRMHLQLWCMTGGVALLSALSAATLPLPLDEQHGWLFGIPGALYALNGVLAPAIRRGHRRRLATLPQAA